MVFMITLRPQKLISQFVCDLYTREIHWRWNQIESPEIYIFFILLNKHWTMLFKIIMTQIAACPSGRRLSQYNRLVLFPAQFGETLVRSVEADTREI